MPKDNFELLKKAHDKQMPAFTFIAQDSCSRAAIAAYRDECRRRQVAREHIQELDRILIEWDEYQETKETKLPD
jgi:hypothetical protein